MKDYFGSDIQNETDYLNKYLQIEVSAWVSDSGLKLMLYNIR